MGYKVSSQTLTPSKYAETMELPSEHVFMQTEIRCGGLLFLRTWSFSGCEHGTVRSAWNQSLRWYLLFWEAVAVAWPSKSLFGRPSGNDLDEKNLVFQAFENTKVTTDSLTPPHTTSRVRHSYCTFDQGGIIYMNHHAKFDPPSYNFEGQALLLYV